jgi:hypothetical protein
LHSLRHTFASLPIAKGLNVVFVSRQARTRQLERHATTSTRTSSNAQTTPTRPGT